MHTYSRQVVLTLLSCARVGKDVGTVGLAREPLYTCSASLDLPLHPELLHFKMLDPAYSYSRHNAPGS